MSVHPEKDPQQEEYEEEKPKNKDGKETSGPSESTIFWKGLRYIFQDFATWTSTHGLPHIALANVTWLKVLWAIVVLVALGGCIEQLVMLILKYLSYGVNTDTELQYSERMFPAVTFCNLNPWKANATAAADTSMNDLIIAYNSQLAYPAWGFDGGLSLSRQQQAEAWATLFSERLIALSQTKNIAYTLDDIVLSCTFNAKNCNNTDFILYSDATYGICQQFNFDGRYTSTRAGPLYGLRMVIQVDQALYLPWTDAQGVVVAIQSQGEDPFPDVLGYFAAPGIASSMGVRYTQTESLPAPYGTCTTQATLNTTQYNGTYAVEACYRACLQEAIIAACGCYDPSMSHASDGTPSCDIGEGSLNNLNCVNTFSSGFNVITQCNCPQPCETGTYTVTVSTAQWPAINYSPGACNQNITSPWLLLGQNCMTWYQKNTLLVEIYYEVMNFNVLTESPAYTLVNLISDIGGQVGLFLGMSIISGLEILFLLVIIICYCCTHKSRKRDFKNLHTELENARDETDKTEAKAKMNQGMYNREGDPVPPAVAES